MSVERYSVLRQFLNRKSDLLLHENERVEVVSAADYAAETARADQAEAGCAAFVALIDKIDWCIGYDFTKHDYETFDELCTLAAQPHPGSRFLELAQIVEGLPVLEGRIYVHKDDSLYASVRVENGNCTSFIAEKLAHKDADAIARLLAWKVKP